MGLLTICQQLTWRGKSRLYAELGLDNNPMMADHPKAASAMRKLVGKFADIFISEDRMVGNMRERFAFQIDLKPSGQPVKQNQ